MHYTLYGTTLLCRAGRLSFYLVAIYQLYVHPDPECDDGLARSTIGDPIGPHCDLGQVGRIRGQASNATWVLSHFMPIVESGSILSIYTIAGHRSTLSALEPLHESWLSLSVFILAFDAGSGRTR
jgi:hypothetical protein